MNKKHLAGVCPVCGSDTLDYLKNRIMFDQLRYYWTCEECGSNGEEVHTLIFSGHVDIDDLSKYKEEK